MRVAAALGVQTLIVTNAAGGIDPTLSPGEIVAIADQLNLTGTSALSGPNDERLGPRFVDMTDAYSPALRALAALAAPAALGRPLREAVYAGVAGPAYETPAEVRMLRTLGAGLVGMSTVHEVTAARHAGLAVLGCRWSRTTRRASRTSRCATRTSPAPPPPAPTRWAPDRGGDRFAAAGCAASSPPRPAAARAGALLAAARAVRAHAHAPYSRFTVGAAVLDDAGRIHAGCNVENASYGLTVCAERNAVAAAVAAGAKSIRAVAIVTRMRRPPATPCGACRQVLAEFAGDDVPILLAGPTGAAREERPGRALAAGFSPARTRGHFTTITLTWPRRRSTVTPTSCG